MSTKKIAEQLEAWEADIKILSNQGKEFELNPQMKLVALEIMFSRFSTIFEAIERGVKDQSPESKFDSVIADLKAYAGKKRWEAQLKKGKGDLLNVDEFPEESSTNTMTVWVDDGYGGFIPAECQCGRPGKRKKQRQRKE